MIVYKCDICGSDCDNRVTRRYDLVQGDLGVEVVFTKGGNPGDVHLCNECLFDLLFSVLDRAPNAKIKDFKFKVRMLGNREAKLNSLETDLVSREHKIDALEKELLEKQNELTKREALIISYEKDKENMASVIEAMKANKEKEIKQAWTSGRQTGLDEAEEAMAKKKG